MKISFFHIFSLDKLHWVECIIIVQINFSIKRNLNMNVILTWEALKYHYSITNWSVCYIWHNVFVCAVNVFLIANWFMDVFTYLFVQKFNLLCNEWDWIVRKWNILVLPGLFLRERKRKKIYKNRKTNNQF